MPKESKLLSFLGPPREQNYEKNILCLVSYDLKFVYSFYIWLSKDIAASIQHILYPMTEYVNGKWFHKQHISSSPQQHDVLATGKLVPQQRSHFG